MEQVDASVVDPTMGWSDLVKGRLLHYRLPGWHDRMFHDEGADMIAERLRPLLDRVEAEARSAHQSEVPATASSISLWFIELVERRLSDQWRRTRPC